MTDREQAQECLGYLKAQGMNHAELVLVAAICKDAGLSMEEFAAWFRKTRDLNPGLMKQQWDSLNGSSNPAGLGSLVNMAKRGGYVPSKAGGQRLEWTDVVQEDGPIQIVDPNYLQPDCIQEPSNWDPAKDCVDYLQALFEPGEHVGYVVDSWEKDGRHMPARGSWSRTAGQLIQELQSCGGDLGRVFGDWDPKVGGWVRPNPLDGQGCRDANVTAYRFALVESDDVPIGEQAAILRQMELPIAALVHSGKKSLHAIVRIDAKDYEQYRRRVDYLYEICAKNGLQPDKQNRNPSRLSRLPGITRGDNKQWLVGLAQGKESWGAWRDWIEDLHDNLPDPEPLAGVWDDLPPLADPLIHGILRQGHKLLLSGPSKAAKSYALIGLAEAIAEGRQWFGWDCAQGRVLYVNLELDRASCLHRFKDTYQARGWAADNRANIDVWNLRGQSVPLDKLAPKLIRRSQKRGYVAVIIDPIYKVITGDENSADQMAQFCNQFDKICHELGAATIYCHHHSKGDQGQKRSMDRASGSGVFARDPDAILDLVELDISDPLRKQLENRAVCDCIAAYLRRCAPDADIDQDTLVVAKLLHDEAERILGQAQREDLRQRILKARTIAKQLTGWRIEGTLREFPRFYPRRYFFRFPIHIQDQDGLLKDAKAAGEEAPWERNKEQRKARMEQRREKERQAAQQSLLDAFLACREETGDVTIPQLAASIGCCEKTVRRKLQEHPQLFNHRGKVTQEKPQ